MVITSNARTDNSVPLSHKAAQTVHLRLYSVLSMQFGHLIGHADGHWSELPRTERTYYLFISIICSFIYSHLFKNIECTVSK